MNKYIIPAAVLAAMAAPGSAAEVQIAASGPVVELTVTESVRGEPDIVTIGAGVSSRAPTAVEAMQQNVGAMDSVINKLTALGISDYDVQTSGISLNPQYDYNQEEQRQIFRGYQASNRVSVTLRDVQKTGKVLDELVRAGATDLSGPDWAIDDDTAARQEARKAAFTVARNRAIEYARLAGYSDVRLLEVSEVSAPSRVYELAGRVVAQAAKADTPVMPGMVESSVTVTVKFEMAGNR